MRILELGPDADRPLPAGRRRSRSQGAHGFRRGPAPGRQGHRTSSIARSADGIPLDSFSQVAAQTVVALFALTGFFRIIVLARCVLALVRYRSAVPFMLGLAAADYRLKQAILHFQPVPSAGGVPGPIANLAISVLTLVGLALSLRTQETGT